MLLSLKNTLTSWQCRWSRRISFYAHVELPQLWRKDYRWQRLDQEFLWGQPFHGFRYELEAVMELCRRCIETCRKLSNQRTPLLSSQSKDFRIYCCILEAEHSDTSLQDGDSDILELHEILKSFKWNFNWLTKMESGTVNIFPSLNHFVDSSVT